MKDGQALALTGLAGVLAAMLFGAGEYMLHVDPLVCYGQGFDFFKGVTESKATTGHFLAVLGGPFYRVGAWHLYHMLRPASRFWAKLALESSLQLLRFRLAKSAYIFSIRLSL